MLLFSDAVRVQLLPRCYSLHQRLAGTKRRGRNNMHMIDARDRRL